MTEASAPNPNLKDLLVFHNVARALTSALDLDSILRAIMQQMEQFFEPEQWSLLIMDDMRQELYYAVAVGHAETEFRDVRVKVGEGLAGWVAEHGESLIVPEVSQDPRFAEAASDYKFRIRSAICMPLRSRLRTLGVIQLFNCRLESLTDYTISFLHVLCDYAAIAIENARAVERIQELTITDDCTGLNNQRHLYRILEKESERGKRFGSQFSLIFIDLDHFKQVNDEYGHQVGSRLLAEFGQSLRALVREVDSTFRYGGDEFIVLLPETGKEEAQKIAEHLHERLRLRRYRVSDRLQLQIRSSFGVATWPDDGRAAHDIIRVADAMMYLVKGSTRDNIAVAGQGLAHR